MEGRAVPTMFPAVVVPAANRPEAAVNHNHGDHLAVQDQASGAVHLLIQECVLGVHGGSCMCCSVTDCGRLHTTSPGTGIVQIWQGQLT